MSVRLLIIDSDLDHGRSMRDSLNGVYGISDVAVALDGFMAGCLVIQFKPDIVLLDLEMPGVDSSHVCRFIKHDPHTRFIRVIAMCRACSELQEQILDLGAEVCLSKPICADTLKQVMGLIDPDAWFLRLMNDAGFSREMNGETVGTATVFRMAYRGEQIPLVAWVFQVADIYDALTDSKSIEAAHYMADNKVKGNE